jgi:hypothetical protein
MVAGIVAQTYLGARVSLPARLNTPYDRVAPAVLRDGFHRGTIVAGRGPLAGNLRVAFPDARIASLETPDYVPPATMTDGDCLVVWEPEQGPGMPEDLRDWLRDRFHVELAAALPVGSLGVTYRHTTGRTFRADYVRLPQGAGECR